MSEKSSPRAISSTNFKKRLGHYLDEVVQGREVTVSRRGKPVVNLEAVQKNLPLLGLPENQIREFHSLVNSLEPEDFVLVVQFVRKTLENKLASKK